MSAPYAEVIGDPVSHSKSPLIHKFWLEKLGLDYDYRRTRIAAGELPAFVTARRDDCEWRGCNVTLPYKQAILPALDEIRGDAEGAGAVNTVVRREDRMIGLNTDVLALKPDILPAAEEGARMGLPVLLFGAGGAARAVAQVLRDIEGLEVLIFNRDVEKAAALLGEFRLNGRALPLGAPLPLAALIVNASSLGMAGFPPLPVDLSRAAAGLVYDLVYVPRETQLLRQAQSLGLPFLDGLHMLISQARLAFTHFFGFAPPEGPDEELRELLAR
jgi:shikimate dehydrogenase